ncbi:MAG: M23 family metallopeptidase [Frankiaceae bacterium]|nr:M23 family metallopeptidase [Frankiaceae bacterium]
MPAQQSRPRHAAPKDPSRTRGALLPGVLLAAAGTAFAGMAALPASAVEVPPRVTAAAALQPVELPAAEPVVPVDQQVNIALGTALAQGLAVANTPPPPPPAPERASRDRDAEAAAGSGATYVRPGTGRLTSQYGRRWGRLHAGIDIAAGVGAPIYATAAGTVKSAGSEGGYGRAVRIVHGDGTVTVYGHMSRLLVSSGQRVAAGEQIGKEGNTGQSTGPHLHFEVRIDGTPVNPLTWLRKRGVDI